MVLRLQTAEDQTKTYQTINNIYGTDGFAPIRCFTKCRSQQDVREEGCDHLECAIYSAKRNKRQSSASVLASLIIIIISFVYSWKVPGSDSATFSLVFFAVVAFVAYINRYRSGKRLNELTEYMDKGTINGIKASHTCRKLESNQEF